MLLLVLFLGGSVASNAQDDAYPKQKKPTPTQIDPEIWVLTEGVVTVQWPSTLELVNAPTNISQVEPGQCVYFGVVVTGDDRDRLLSTARSEFTVQYGGRTQILAAEKPAAMKQIKPVGGDLVTGALGAAGIKNPFPSFASMAASHARWCMPEGGSDGAISVGGSVLRPNGAKVQLKSRTIQAMTFDSARRNSPLTTMKVVDGWLQMYYTAPDPAQLLPALRVISADTSARKMLNIMQFFVTALRESPLAAAELLRKLPSESAAVKSYSLPLLEEAGYSVDGSTGDLPPEDKAAVLSARLPDPFDLTPNRMLFQKQDMLWCIFLASGEIKPVRTVASMLAWESDYLELAKLREAHQRDPNQHAELTASIVRGAAYGAAGWSLGSLSRRDGLVADYVDVIKQSPDFPGEAKQLDALFANPAFKGE